MLNRDETLSRLLALFVGVGLFFFVGIAPALLLGDNSPLHAPIDVAVYGAVGAAFGLAWPSVGWRLGLYLWAFWPPMLLFAAFLGGELLAAGIVDWAGTFRDLAGALLLLTAACFGAEAGSVVGRQRRAKTAGA